MKRASWFGLAAVACASSIAAQSDSSTHERNQFPPIRPIATATAVTKQSFVGIWGVRELPDGRVLVNEVYGRRLVLLDTNLATERVVLDSIAGRDDAYGSQVGILFAYRGDSTLFFDVASPAMLVIDPKGQVVRVRSVPRGGADLNSYAYYGGSNNSLIAPIADAQGRLVYVRRAQPAMPLRRPPRGTPWFPVQPDSAFIVALSIEDRTLDTIGVIRTPKVRHVLRMMPGGYPMPTEAINPLPVFDDWVVLPDGTVAFLRAIDLRVDYINPDGSRSSSAKIPYEWQPLSDSAKQHLVDSVYKTNWEFALTDFTNSVIRWANVTGRTFPANFTIPKGYKPPNGFGRDWRYPAGVTFPADYIYACAEGEQPKLIPVKDSVLRERLRAMGSDGMPSCAAIPSMMRQRMRRSEGSHMESFELETGASFSVSDADPTAPKMRPVNVVSARELPDFRPPIAPGAIRGDMDGNLWIRTIPPKPIPGGDVFNIVTRDGQLIDRLQLPQGYYLAGFGRGKVVYLVTQQGRGMKLARVRLK